MAMLEIFIPTEIPGILSLKQEDPGFLSLVNRFSVTVYHWETRFFRGIHITTDKSFQELCILCNGTFGSEYFIDYDWEKQNIITLGQHFFGPDTIWEKLGSITSDFDSLIRTLGSDTLLTTTKKNESIGKIRHSFFLLSGVVFSLTELLRKTRENMQELRTMRDDPLQKSEYQGQSALLLETLITREVELESSRVLLEEKVAIFIQATKHLITQ